MSTGMVSDWSLTHTFNMIRKKLWLIALAIAGTCAAQEQKHHLSIGIGVPNIPRQTFNRINVFESKSNYSNKGKGPYHIKYEYRPLWYFGLGLNLNYMDYQVSYSEDAIDTIQGKLVMNNIKISAWNLASNIRANVYFTNPENRENLDIYIGIGMGYRFGDFKVESELNQYKPKVELPSLLKLGLEATFGFRYFFNENIGIYSEIGPAKSLVQAGITARF